MNKKDTDVFVIWSSDINIEDWQSYIEECWSDYQSDPEMGGFGLSGILEEYFDDTEEPSLDEFKSKYEYELYSLISEENDAYLDDERTNLDIETGRIICIASLGLWNGRVSGYSYEGENINSIFHSHIRGQSEMDFYVEKVGRTLELKADEHHHDGTNHYLYRELKPDLSDEQISNFEFKIYEGKATRADINRYTNPLGQRVQKVYGFEIGKKPKQAERE